MKERVHKTLEALEACSGRSCGLCPYTASRTSACERMLKTDAAALVADLWGIVSQPVQNAAQEVQPFTRASILEAARKCVCGEREGEYGTPEDNFAHIANLWETYLLRACVVDGCFFQIQPEDVATMMALMKLCRMMGGQFKYDNYVDACGYLACAGELAAPVSHDEGTN